MARRKGTLAIALCAALLLAPAVAEGGWVIEGRGFGHGVGLSQYGAYGFAKRGTDYKRILEHYYTGTEVGKVGGEQVRVLLASGRGSVEFSGAKRACGRKLNPRRRYAFETAGAGVALHRAGGGRIEGCGGEGVARARVIRIEGEGRYRGDLVARAGGDGLMVINRLGTEAYVKGVVPNEVPSSWPQDALRAQAVVARSYGIATERGGAFDHYDDTRSQVYGGLASETKATNRAVKATKGEVVKFRGKPAITYYFSTSGGQTENSEFGFSGGNAIPYLKSVRDPYDKVSPLHTWTMRLSDRQMEQRLSGLFSGKLRAIEVVETGRSPRIVRARVVGTNGSKTVSGDTLRSRLGLRSTWARFERR